jgi:hypothetical protein
MFRTYRSILRSVYKLSVAGLVCEDCVLLGAFIRYEVVEQPHNAIKAITMPQNILLYFTHGLTVNHKKVVLKFMTLH